MKIAQKKRDRLAGIAEKIGLTVLLGSWADILITHRLNLILEIAGVVLGLIFLFASVKLTPDE